MPDTQSLEGRAKEAGLSTALQCANHHAQRKPSTYQPHRGDIIADRLPMLLTFKLYQTVFHLQTIVQILNLLQLILPFFRHSDSPP